MSELDIGAGARWNNDLSEQLDLGTVGMVCVTPSNLGSVWLHFEAGAISKHAGTSILIPFLHRVSIGELSPSPLARCARPRHCGR